MISEIKSEYNRAGWQVRSESIPDRFAVSEEDYGIRFIFKKAEPKKYFGDGPYREGPTGQPQYG